MTVGRIMGMRESVWCDWWNWSIALHKWGSENTVHIRTIMCNVSPCIVLSIFQICRLLLFNLCSYVSASATYLTRFFLNECFSTLEGCLKNEATSQIISIIPPCKSFFSPSVILLCKYPELLQCILVICYSPLVRRLLVD